MLSDGQIRIPPITAAQRERVVAATHACLAHAESVYQKAFPVIPVHFDLRGRTAGMYRVYRGTRSIRYNPCILAKYFEEGLRQTVPHEVAHYVADLLHGLRKVRPHGPEWRSIAQQLGASPRATCRFDLNGIPQRRQTWFDYRCNCTRHQLGVRRHNRVQRGEAVYLCRRCCSALVYCGTGPSPRPAP